jgi:hypothetical protein
MGFSVTHADGRMERDPDLSTLDALVAELDTADDEHPDVSVSNELGWTLSAHRSGLVIWENVEDGEPRHMKDIARAEVKRLWLDLVTENLDAIERESWLPGYG